MSHAAEQTVTLHRPRAKAAPAPAGDPRWSVDAIEALFNLPFPS